MNMHDFDGAPCVDNPRLWESLWPSDHRIAAQGCRTCPHIVARLERLDWAKSKAVDAHHGPRGTWAGMHINPHKKTGRPKKEVA